MKSFIFSFAFGALLSLSFQTSAGDVSNAKKLICAPVTAVECGTEGNCESGTAESIDFPRFIWIDLDKRQALGEASDGKKRTSKIMNVVDSEGSMILQGAQLGRGWSAVINKATGKFVVTTSGTDFAFVVFGSCTRN
jgi:hypothetical protein